MLVGNVAGTSVQVWPADLPKEDHGRDRVLKRLAGVLDVNVYWLIHQVEKRARDPLTPVTVKRRIHDSQVMYLEERQDEFPGVKVAETFLRDYPHRALAAHVLGHVGEVTERQIEDNQQLRPGDEVGQGGVEATYDRFLGASPAKRGSASTRSVARSRPSRRRRWRPEHLRGWSTCGSSRRRRTRCATGSGSPGRTRRGPRTAAPSSRWTRNGEILALASNPTFKPNVFVGRTDPEKLAPLLNARVAERENYRGLNRALAGLYPPGSRSSP